MGGENTNNSGENTSDERAEWQSLGHKIAEQIASHTTTDKNGDPVYIGKELPEEMQAKVEKVGFRKQGEKPRGTDKDGLIDNAVYPKRPDESIWDLRDRRSTLQHKTDRAILEQIDKKANETLSAGTVSKIYDTLLNQDAFRDNNPSDDKRNTVVNEARDLALKTANHYYRAMLPNNSKHGQYVSEAYENVYARRIVEDEPMREIMPKELENQAIDEAILDSRRDGYNRSRYAAEKRPIWEYQHESLEVANKSLQEYSHEIFSGLFDNDLKISEEEAEKRRKSAILNTIEAGLYLPNTTTQNPEEADRILSENGINKESHITTALALEGYDDADKERKKDIAKYFDLNGQVDKMMDDPQFKYYYSGGKLWLEGNKYQRESRLKFFREPQYSMLLDPEISQAALERLSNVANQIEDDINNNPGLIEKVRDEAKVTEEAKLANDVAQTISLYNLGLLLKTTKIDCSDRVMGHLIESHSSSKSFSDVLAKYINGRNDLKIETNIDCEKAIRDGLTMRLAQGIVMHGRNVMDLTEIFESQDYKNNEARIGIDFSDKTIMHLSFGGFLNLIGTRNGEVSPEADWYFDNVFSNDLGEFKSIVKSYRNSGVPNRTTIDKLGRFMNRHKEDFRQYERQKKVDERAQDAERDRKRMIKAEEITRVDTNFIRNLVLQRRSFLLNKLGNRNPAIVSSTFDGNTMATSSNVGQNSSSNYIPMLNKEAPFDFGEEKVNKLISFADFIDQNIPNSNVQVFVRNFNDKNKSYNSPDAYVGFWFDYEGKRCLIAESFNNDAAMYAAIEDSESGFGVLDMFDDPKSYSINNPNVAAVDHLDRDNFDDSLDVTYQKVMFFLRTGNEADAKYGLNGKANWQQRQALQFPAWPILFDNGAQMDDLAGYQAWQEQLMQNQDELVDEKLRMWNRR